jgi:saxitoxin biosynthesis operon SxtJ-like protein
MKKTKSLTVLDGNWDEFLDGDGRSGSSDRAFGLLFAALTGIAAGFAAWHGRSSAFGWAAVAALFLVSALLAPALLGPLNRLWRGLGLLLSRITTPIVMGVLFFAVVTPVGVLMRASGKDPLRLRPDRGASSYWLARAGERERQTSMTRQF